MQTILPIATALLLLQVPTSRPSPSPHRLKAPTSRPSQRPMTTRTPMSQPTKPPTAEIVKPTKTQPPSIARLVKLVQQGKRVRTGFINSQLEVGSSGFVESIRIESIVDRTSMIAYIRFPELQAIEMAPGAFSSGDYTHYKSPGRYWGSGEVRVWIRGIDTSGLVDGRIVFLSQLVEVTTTDQEPYGKTIFVVQPISTTQNQGARPPSAQP